MLKLYVGMCTVTRKVSYLEQTLDSLLKNRSGKYDDNIGIVVYMADDIVNPPEKYLKSYQNPIQFQKLESPPPLVNPEKNFGDSDERIAWRSKQCWDFGQAFIESEGLAEYYMHIEDDVIAGKNWDSYVFDEIGKAPDNWATMHLCSGGMIGWVFKNKDLIKLGGFFMSLRDEMPPDWLINSFVQLKIFTGKHHIQTNYSIFQHIGVERSFPGHSQYIVFPNFIGG